MAPKKPEEPQKPGLREKKKAATRLAISNVATGLFIARGFDGVTVAEVAEAANVSPATIFNYFEAKEDLFFDREQDVIDAHGAYVRGRKKGESIVSALHRGFSRAIDQIIPQIADSGAQFLKTIEDSPALRSRARIALEKTELSLAKTIAEEIGAKSGDPMPHALAAIVVGVERMLLERMRVLLLAKESEKACLRVLHHACDRAFELVEDGAKKYGKRGKTSSKRDR